MRKWFRIKPFFLIVAILGVIAWLALREPPEPTYQGKPLSAWLEGYVSSGRIRYVERDSDTDEAIRQIGANAIPVVLRMLRESDSQVKSALRSELMKLASKQDVVRIKFPTAWFGAYFPTRECSNTCQIMTRVP
jgi:hypothetical protein